MSDEDETGATGEAGEFEGSSGDSNQFDAPMETIEVVIGFGVDFHKWDWFKSQLPNDLGAPVEVNDSDEIEYTNTEQGIHYRIRMTESKQEFKTALETEDIIVIYAGHSRYGRGCCFGQVPDGTSEEDPTAPGEHWEVGSDEDDGLLRMAFPYVAVEIDDIHHHGYTFHPLSVAEPAPPRSERHPEAAAAPVAIELPEDLRDWVAPEHADPDHRYWGYPGAKTRLLMRAGWSGTLNDPFDLGATNLQCRCFCHFGCSSRLHFRPLIRGSSYKAWERDDPPTRNFAYFTTEAAPPPPTASIWLGRLMNSTVMRGGDGWAAGLRDAMQRSNQRIAQIQRSEDSRYVFRIY